MATTTPNFGWSVPTSTDLVKDGATAIETLGDAIDASLVDLKGGTSGQVLAKNSNTDMDFTWVAQDDSNAIQNALLTTTGDTIYASGASTPARLGIGTTGQVLTVSGGVPAWATPASGGSLTQLATGTLSGSSVNVSSLSGSYKGLKVIVRGWRPTQDGNNLEVRFNNDGNTRYAYSQPSIFGAAADFNNADMFALGYSADNSVSPNLAIMDVWDYANTTSWKFAQFYAINANYTDSTKVNFSQSQCAWNQTDAITAITFGADGGTFAAGTYYIYGVN